MFELLKYTIIGIFGISSFIFINHSLSIFDIRKRAHSRLLYRKRGQQIEKWLRDYVSRDKTLKKIDEMLEVFNYKVNLSTFTFITLFLAAFGYLLGVKGIGDFVYGVILFSVFAMLPYIALRWFIMGYQNALQKELLIGFTVFFESYTAHKNMRNVLQHAIPQIRYPLRYHFEDLLLMFNNQVPFDEVARLFKLRVGGKFAAEFITIFQIGFETGIDVAKPLQDLIEEMHEHEEEIEEDRARDVEIRVANISSLFVFLLFLFINAKQNEKWFYYYFVEPQGKFFTLLLIVIIFISFVVGIYLIRRRR